MLSIKSVWTGYCQERLHIFTIDLWRKKVEGYLYCAMKLINNDLLGQHPETHCWAIFWNKGHIAILNVVSNNWEKYCYDMYKNSPKLCLLGFVLCWGGEVEKREANSISSLSSLCRNTSPFLQQNDEKLYEQGAYPCMGAIMCEDRISCHFRWLRSEGESTRSSSQYYFCKIN